MSSETVRPLQRKRSLSSCFGAFVVSLAVVSCAARQTGGLRPSDALPPLGLYRVVDRRCENPLNEPQNCMRIAYVELAHSKVAHLAPHPAVLIFWLAPDDAQSDFTYETWPVYGRFTSPDKYLLHDEGSVRDWLVVREGAIHEYDLEAFQTDQRREIRVRSRLSLEPIPRTPDLDRRLQLVPD